MGQSRMDRSQQSCLSGGFQRGSLQVCSLAIQLIEMLMETENG